MNGKWMKLDYVILLSVVGMSLYMIEWNFRIEFHNFYGPLRHCRAPRFQLCQEISGTRLSRNHFDLDNEMKSMYGFGHIVFSTPFINFLIVSNTFIDCI